MLKELLTILEAQDGVSPRAEKVLKHLADLHLAELLNDKRLGKLTPAEVLEELMLLASVDERNILEVEKHTKLVDWVKNHTKFPTPVSPVREAVDTSPKPFTGDLKWTADDAIRLQNSLGARIEFKSFKEWSKALPHGWTLHQNQIPWHAQARTKQFEGVAGKWDPEHQKGWIYEHYLNYKRNTES